MKPLPLLQCLEAAPAGRAWLRSGDGASLDYAGLRARIAARASDRPGRGRLQLDAGGPAAQWAIRLLAGLLAGRQVVLTDPHWTPALRAAALASLPPMERRAPEPGLWLFTSGTTARPRPCFRSLPALDAMLGRIRAALPRQLAAAAPRLLCLAPLHHGFGLMNGLLLGLALQGTLILGGSDPSRALAAAAPVDMLYAWPSHYQALLAGLAGDPAAAAALPQWCVSSAWGLDPALAAAFEAASGIRIRQQYGQTETGPLCLDREQPASGLPRCVGRPLAGVAVRVGPAAGDGTGPIQVRVPDLDPDPASGEPWRDTGDLGRLDAQGRLFVHRRAQDFTDERSGA